MSAQLIGLLIDKCIPFFGGALCALYGFRKLGPIPGVNLAFDRWYAAWGPLLKWGGLLLIAYSLIAFLLGVLDLQGREP